MFLLKKRICYNRSTFKEMQARSFSGTKKGSLDGGREMQGGIRDNEKGKGVRK